MARRQNARHLPGLERMGNQSLPESRSITATVVSASENPAEFNILRVQISTRAKSGEADDFIGRFQADSLVTELIVRPEMSGDEYLRIDCVERSLVQHEAHQFRIAENRDERAAIATPVGSQDYVAGVESHVTTTLPLT